MERVDDQAVDPAAAGGVDSAPFSLQGAVGVVGDQIVAVGLGHVLDAPDQVGIEGVGDVGDDRGDGHRPAGAEGAGGIIGHVAQLGDGVLNAFAGLR